MADQEQKIAAVENSLRLWVTSIRRGKNQDLPCYWSMYPVNSKKATIRGNTPKLSENLEVADKEESLEILMEDMQMNTSAKYYAIRLRKDSKDTEYLNFFDNPYYQAESRAKLSGHNQTTMQQGDQLQMFMLQNMFVSINETKKEAAAAQAAAAEAQQKAISVQIEMLAKVQEKQAEIDKIQMDARIGNLTAALDAEKQAKIGRLDQLLDRATPLVEMYMEGMMNQKFNTPENNNTTDSASDHSQGQAKRDSGDPKKEEALEHLENVVQNANDLVFLKDLYVSSTWLTEEQRKEFALFAKEMMQQAKMNHEAKKQA